MSLEPGRGKAVEEVKSSGGPGEVGMEVLLMASGRAGR